VVTEAVCLASPQKIVNEEIIGSEKFITKEEVAERLRVTSRTVDNWMKKNVIPFRKIGRTVRFDWAEVRDHLAQKTGKLSSIPFHQTRGPGIADSLRERAKEIRRNQRPL